MQKMNHNTFFEIEKARMEGKKIGFTASSFDLLHPGHISMLAEAKSHCDFLVVGLLTDPTISRPDTKNKPIQSTFERFVQIQAISYIDELIPFDSEEDLVQMIKMIKPHIRFCGIEYKGTHHTGWDIKDVDIFYNRRDHDYSTTELRERVYEIELKKHPEHTSPIISQSEINNKTINAIKNSIEFITKVYAVLKKSSNDIIVMLRYKDSLVEYKIPITYWENHIKDIIHVDERSITNDISLNQQQAAILITLLNENHLNK